MILGLTQSAQTAPPNPLEVREEESSPDSYLRGEIMLVCESLAFF
jgi:hypothetical protein